MTTQTNNITDRLPEWPEFSAQAPPAYRREAELIMQHDAYTPCQMTTRLQCLIRRWRAWRRQTAGVAAAVLLLVCGTARAETVRVVVDIRDASAAYRMACRTAAIAEQINAAVRARFPGLSRYASQREYQVAITDLPDGVFGRHTPALQLIQLDWTLGTDPERLKFVYAHEMGHAIWTGLPEPDRRLVVDEYAAACRAGEMPAGDVAEIFADLVARFATGRLVERLPRTQKMLREKLCR